ncbi:hypothetical protein BU23DRAFT_299785 [Bimuria novae-zelandiae CBS 107.79]|uniref:Uncharacterized protein n=1 Tax=Bimuria novae-zelandiae CBS 107.79 TaxID=1447943 RepID=A0A6A5VL27_9PLEO|nr:hypothetical protein BU23DRAFT_299785 [Bimuria novae-zelandiae CBS 107.79]
MPQRPRGTFSARSLTATTASPLGLRQDASRHTFRRASYLLFLAAPAYSLRHLLCVPMLQKDLRRTDAMHCAAIHYSHSFLAQ